MTGPNRTPGSWLKADDWKFGPPADEWQRVAPLPSDLPPYDPDPRELPADYGTVAPDRATRIDWEYVAALVVAGALIVGLIVLWPK